MIQPLLLLYAALLLFGGVMGYVMAGSFPSLIAGSLSFAFVAFGLWGMKLGKNWARALLLGVTALLLLFFWMRFFGTFALFPAGVMTLVSAGILAVLLRK